MDSFHRGEGLKHALVAVGKVDDHYLIFPTLNSVSTECSGQRPLWKKSSRSYNEPAIPEGAQTIEGFGGKRALGFLRKSELHQNRSKFRMQFCLGALNNVLHVFSLKLASFSKYYVCKKPVFVVMSARDGKDGNFIISLKIQQNIDLSQRVSLKKC